MTLKLPEGNQIALMSKKKVNSDREYRNFIIKQETIQMFKTDACDK